ncbi:MAG TPA: hypothetical protein VIL82_11325 [Solirubrobacteraceae bacterium]|jgi:hypothetical protein
MRLIAGIAAALALAACGGARAGETSPGTGPLRLPADERPAKIGRGAGFRPAPLSAAVVRAEPVGGLRCTRAADASYGVHLELYAHRLVVPVPSGIGVAPPQRRRGVYVLGGRCVYPLRTTEPTGVVVVQRGRVPSLGELFAIWGQPLSGHALASFRGGVSAYVGGRRWTGPPATIPLRRHAEIVLEIEGAVLPHPAYRFPPGL